jgi:lipoyl(octanoyl) transferase
MSARWRIIDTGPQGPFANMALDEALLLGYELHDSPPTLRIYGWQPTAISIGYSQDPQAILDADLVRKESMQFVRRITGGGIIMHGDEITYSLVCSKSDLDIPARVVSSYKMICSFLISFYKTLGIDASFACDANSEETLGIPSALCFAAKEKYDITVNGRKIGGSAQKRLKNVIFQHGSIPIGRVNIKEAASLEDILGRRPDIKELSRLLQESFVKTFKIEVQQGELSNAERSIFLELKTHKYETRDWNYNRIDRAAKASGRHCDSARCITHGGRSNLAF